MRRNTRSVMKCSLTAAAVVSFIVIMFHYLRWYSYTSSIKPPRRERTTFEFFQNHQNLKFLPRDIEYKQIINDDDEKIDWHDYKRIEEDRKRIGMGEQGKPSVLSSSLSYTKQKLYHVNGYNAALSDHISLNRSLPDIRHPDCRTKKYSKKLDRVSVVISFHNEHLSTLLRTCWSIINRSPPSLLEEIVLVDDASTKLELKDKLDRYVKENLPWVKIVRLDERSGLIHGRLTGAKVARAKILVFLDSHCEVNINWLPPLLEPISENSKTCVCPLIDVIAHETFEYRAQDEGGRGAFDWELYYKRLPMLPEDLKHPSKPFKNPVMAGGLFAINAKFFWEIGGYDSGFDIWGGEQYELSFKIWQCGGQIYDAPCSRVGHIYRKFPPFLNPDRGVFLGRNYKRVAEVWMDDYARYVYERLPHLLAMDPGDLTEQKNLRKNLHCNSFEWYIENVAPDLIEYYPVKEPVDFASGEIRNIGVSELCLDVKKREKEEYLIVNFCKKDDPKIMGEQEFRLTWHKNIRPMHRTDCLDVAGFGARTPVNLYPCHGKLGNQMWRYDIEKQWLIFGYGLRCLDTDPAEKRVFVVACDVRSSTQKWRMEYINMKAMNNWHNIGPKTKRSIN